MYFYRVPPVTLSVEPPTASIPRFGNQSFTITANDLPFGEGGTLAVTNTNPNFTTSSNILFIFGDPPSDVLIVGYSGTGSQSTQITITGLDATVSFTVNGIP
jgi:hypothetical protein